MSCLDSQNITEHESEFENLQNMFGELVPQVVSNSSSVGPVLLSPAQRFINSCSTPPKSSFALIHHGQDKQREKKIKQMKGFQLIIDQGLSSAPIIRNITNIPPEGRRDERVAGI